MKNFLGLSCLKKIIDVLFFLHIRENYILYQQKHAFNQPRCMYFSALPRTTPCVLDFLVFCYVDEGSAYVLLPPNTKFTGKTNHSYTTTKQLEKRFWLCQKFRGQLFVPAEPVVRRKGEKSINALAPLPKLYIPSTINIWRKLLTILAE